MTSYDSSGIAPITVVSDNGDRFSNTRSNFSDLYNGQSQAQFQPSSRSNSREVKAPGGGAVVYNGGSGSGGGSRSGSGSIDRSRSQVDLQIEIEQLREISRLRRELQQYRSSSRSKSQPRENASTNVGTNDYDDEYDSSSSSSGDDENDETADVKRANVVASVPQVSSRSSTQRNGGQSGSQSSRSAAPSGSRSQSKSVRKTRVRVIDAIPPLQQQQYHTTYNTTNTVRPLPVARTPLIPNAPPVGPRPKGQDSPIDIGILDCNANGCTSERVWPDGTVEFQLLRSVPPEDLGAAAIIPGTERFPEVVFPNVAASKQLIAQHALDLNPLDKIVRMARADPDPFKSAIQDNSQTDFGSDADYKLLTTRNVKAWSATQTALYTEAVRDVRAEFEAFKVTLLLPRRIYLVNSPRLLEEVFARLDEGGTQNMYHCRVDQAESRGGRSVIVIGTELFAQLAASNAAGALALLGGQKALIIIALRRALFDIALQESPRLFEQILSAVRPGSWQFIPSEAMLTERKRTQSNLPSTAPLPPQTASDIAAAAAAALAAAPVLPQLGLFIEDPEIAFTQMWQSNLPVHGVWTYVRGSSLPALGTPDNRYVLMSLASEPADAICVARNVSPTIDDHVTALIACDSYGNMLDLTFNPAAAPDIFVSVGARRKRLEIAIDEDEQIGPPPYLIRTARMAIPAAPLYIRPKLFMVAVDPKTVPETGETVLAVAPKANVIDLDNVDLSINPEFFDNGGNVMEYLHARFTDFFTQDEFSPKRAILKPAAANPNQRATLSITGQIRNYSISQGMKLQPVAGIVPSTSSAGGVVLSWGSPPVRYGPFGVVSDTESTLLSSTPSVASSSTPTTSTTTSRQVTRAGENVSQQTTSVINNGVSSTQITNRTTRRYDDNGDLVEIDDDRDEEDDTNSGQHYHSRKHRRQIR